MSKTASVIKPHDEPDVKVVEKIPLGVLLEFRFRLYKDTDAFYMIMVDRKLTREEIRGIEELVSRYLKENPESKPEETICNLLTEAGLHWWHVPYAGTIRI